MGGDSNDLGRDNGGSAVLKPATTWSSDLEYFTLALTGHDGRWKRFEPINRQVVSVFTEFFNLHVWKTLNTFDLIGATMLKLR